MIRHGMTEINWYADATLVSETGHVFCEGSLVRCVRRWRRLKQTDRLKPVIKIGRDGIPPAILIAADIAALSENSVFPKRDFCGRQSTR